MAAMAAFCLDATPLARRLDWSGAQSLADIGMAADMTKAGCPPEGIQPVLEVVKANLGHLDALRMKALSAMARLSQHGLQIEGDR